MTQTAPMELSQIEFPIGPRDFCRIFNENPQNVYYWVKTEELGNYADEERKANNGPIELKKEDVEFLLEKRKNARRTFRHTNPASPRRVTSRERSTASAATIQERIGVDQGTATTIKEVIDGRLDDTLPRLLKTMPDAPEKKASVKAKMWFIGTLIGNTKLSRIKLPEEDATLFYFIRPSKKSDYTVIYSLLDGYFFFENANQIAESHDNYQVEDLT